MRYRGEFRDDRPSRCWHMAIYRFSKWLPSAILDFWKFKILTAGTVQRANRRHCAEFFADQSNRCGDMIVCW